MNFITVSVRWLEMGWRSEVAAQYLRVVLTKEKYCSLIGTETEAIETWRSWLAEREDDR
jgi:hypothetical protein